MNDVDKKKRNADKYRAEIKANIELTQLRF